MLTAVTGINWGDEGKGRVIDLLAENADIVARYQGGNNAGHTVVTEKGKFILNLLPSGILHPDVTCVLGTGMVIDLEHLANEMQAIEARGVEVSPKNLKLSDKATISMPWHKVQDGLEEDRLAQKGSAFGSTRRGIAYAYSDKYRKKTLRLGDLLHLDEKRTQNRLHMILDSKNMELAGCYHQEKMSYDALLNWCKLQAEHFTPYICDVGAFLQQAHDSGKRIVLEAQLGAMRDIDYGIFPFTSSSNTLAAYAPLGAGIPNCKLDHVVGVLKSYSTCVGAGPFAAENAMGEEWNEKLRKAGGEYGAPTAEVPVTNIYRDVILDEKQLPIKNCAYTQCFRREAGSYGKDVRGLNRLHEFSKVELVRIDKPEHSKESHQEMLNHVEGLLQKLELPYRILRLCGGDMSFTAALCFDFEVYSEAQKRWLEVSSVSNFDTYQANRLKCRYRTAEKKTELCHTLNGSALALPRIVAALLENNQTPEGIRIPKALVPYTGFEVID